MHLFHVIFKYGDRYLISASPERYIKKEGKRIFQPIKGTKKRGLNSEEDEQLKKSLYEDEKERSENVMIVDLSEMIYLKSLQNTVVVDELLQAYTFDQVHHMISTISCELDEEKPLKMF